MASSKITVTVEINTEKIEKLCDALKGLQTYKLAENDDRTLVVMDDVAEVLADYITTYTERKTGRWIPVTERLPEDIKPVIVTWENIDPKSYYQYIVGKRFIGTAHYKNGKWFWYSSVTEDLLAEYGRCDSEEFDEAIEVISWMPLPEPYEEK